MDGSWDKTQEEGGASPRNQARGLHSPRGSPSPTQPEDIAPDSRGTADPGPDPPPGFTPDSEGPSRPQVPPHSIPCSPTRSLP